MYALLYYALSTISACSFLASLVAIAQNHDTTIYWTAIYTLRGIIKETIGNHTIDIAIIPIAWTLVTTYAIYTPPICSEIIAFISAVLDGIAVAIVIHTVGTTQNIM